MRDLNSVPRIHVFKKPSWLWGFTQGGKCWKAVAGGVWVWGQCGWLPLTVCPLVSWHWQGEKWALGAHCPASLAYCLKTDTKQRNSNSNNAIKVDCTWGMASEVVLWPPQECALTFPLHHIVSLSLKNIPIHRNMQNKVMNYFKSGIDR